MSKSPLFSIIIPVFENSEYLIQGLANLLDQTEERLEIIYGLATPDILDEEELQEFELDDPRIKILNTERGRSLGSLYNHCLEQARGRYIIFLHATDVLDHYTLEDIARDQRKAPSKHHCYLTERGTESVLHRTDHLYTHLKGIDSYGCSWSYIFHRTTIKRAKLQFPDTNSPNILARYSARYTKLVRTKNIQYHDKVILILFEEFEFPPAIAKEHIRNSKRLLQRLQQALDERRIPQNLERTDQQKKRLSYLTFQHDFLLLGDLDRVFRELHSLAEQQ